MTRFLNILNKRFTIGNLLTIIASFIFAIIVRQSYLYIFDYLPTKGELELLDISFFGIVMLFKYIFSAYFEYLLNDKFSTPLYESIGTGVKQKGLDVTTLKMVDRDNQGSSSSVEKSPEGESTLSEQDRDFVRKLIAKKGIRANEDFLNEQFAYDGKMCKVLTEQAKQICKLSSLKKKYNLEYFEENGGLVITAPVSMADSEAEKLSKQVGAIDRGLNNKFSEYKNMMKKDARLYGSMWTDANKGTWDDNQKDYKELFNKSN